VRRSIVCAAVSVVLAAGAPPVHARTEIPNARPGGRISGDGRPTAVVVMDGGGTVVATWSAGGGTAPDDWVCRYHGFAGEGEDGFEVAIEVVPAPVLEVGMPYALTCRDGSGFVVYQQFVVWDPADPLAGVAIEERAAQLAAATLSPPAPEVRSSPLPDAEQLTGLPTWLWVSSWSPVEATANLGGVAATVMARPVAMRWRFGDGGVVDCAGPGAPWPGAVAPARSGSTTIPAAVAGSPCTYVFTTTSAGQPDGRYQAEVTVEWNVTWTSSTGVGGSLGSVTSSATTRLRVVEVQAVIEY
jgi:hypothetical protein